MTLDHPDCIAELSKQGNDKDTLNFVLDLKRNLWSNAPCCSHTQDYWKDYCTKHSSFGTQDLWFLLMHAFVPQIWLPPFNVILTMQILEQVLTCISYSLFYHSMWLRACTSEQATIFYQQHKYPSSWSWRGQRLVCDNHWKCEGLQHLLGWLS